MPRRWAKAATTARVAALAGTALLAACTVGPDYHRAPVIIPAAYKEQDGWKPSHPQDMVNRGPWWSIYDDPVLDGLERQVAISNQNLKASEAAYREARAVVQAARAGFFPVVSFNTSVQRLQRQGSSSGGFVSSNGTVTQGRSASSGQTQFNLSPGATWDLDVWGRIRRTVESDVASAQVSAADLVSARLSAQALLATDYFELRAADELKRLLDDAVVAYTQSLQITQNQYKAGVASRADVVTAETQLKNTQAQAINVGVQRAQLEHAIAVLIGKPASSFSLAPAPLATEVPVVPPGVPSTLLERRPDIAAAERQMAAANAQIGVAIAAFYPDITLSASYSATASTFAGLFQAANGIWAFGPSLAQTLLDGGLRSAQVEEARATYDQTVANYRETVLTGFQQVEDELAALRILEQQAAVQADAVRSAREAERLTLNQYRAGTVAYTSVIVAQTTALADEQTALAIRQNRLVASVALIEALGGGWDASQLPTRDQVEDIKTVSPAEGLIKDIGDELSGEKQAGAATPK
ncbi:MAG TPA: efflux transporter outer membrane subunit [Alphaproteobacteria bacterium]|nr:efflux transporter outer membrane subunit [Alphaproteobacteria bacterium]